MKKTFRKLTLMTAVLIASLGMAALPAHAGISGSNPRPQAGVSASVYLSVFLSVFELYGRIRL